MSDSSIQFDMDKAFELLATKLSVLPDTMAWILARYREIEGIDNAAIARQLGIDPDQLNHLALCARPRSDLFNEDIESIAEHLSMQPRPLVQLVRHVEAIETFRYHSGAGSAGLLAAAREIAEEPSAPYQSGDESGKSEDTDAKPDDEQ